MKDKKAHLELENYFWDSLRIISVCLELIDEGQPAFYRVIAVQLRMLLCDTTREHDQVADISLLPRVYPGIVLQPLDKKGRFDFDADGIPLEKWLDQKVYVLDKTVSLRKLIRLTCDHEAGRIVDPRRIPRKQLKAERDWIIEIGRYLTEEEIEDKSL